MNDFLEKRKKESEQMLEIANQMYSKESPNRVFPTVDNSGGIQAYVFGNEGIVSVVPCYDDKVAGKFATRLSYPQLEKIISSYAEKNGMDVSQVDVMDDNFISYALQLFSMKDNGYEITHAAWDHSYSGYGDMLYDSMQDAINSMYSDDVFFELTKDGQKKK
ncbi:MAG: hypothetical protein IKE90_03570 [Bacilli bacterium]|nr:hypothetical protein [Bacilli bacterium]